MVVWVTLALLVICGFYGWRAGLVRRVLELAGVVLAILASARLASLVAPWLGEHSAMDETTALLASYFLVFVAALVATRFAAKAIAAFVHWTPLGWIDRVGGAICGVALGALLVSVGLIAVSMAPRGEAVREAYTSQPVGDVIFHAAPSLYQGANELLGGRVDELWQRAVKLGGEVVERAEDGS